MKVDLITNGPDDHYKKMIIGWLGQYGIDFNEIYISELGPEERAELKKELRGVALKGPTI